jgi:rubrerythrin
MRTFSRLATMPQKGARTEKRVLVCDLCGERLEIDTESGEQRCPVCEMPELEE